MRNWSVNISALQKDPARMAVWELEQRINFGSPENEPLDRKLLEKYWDQLNIDPAKRAYLRSLLDE